MRLVERAFPLEVFGSGPPDPKELGQEWWLAAIQEPEAVFKPYTNPEWPETTLPAFEAVWCARQQDEGVAHRLDLRIRQAFFAESANLARRDLYPGLAREVGLDLGEFRRLYESDRPRLAVLAEGRLGQERYHVHGTPTLMLADGPRLKHPIAYPKMVEARIVAVPPLPCCGEGCYDAVRRLFEQALVKPG